MKLLSEVQEATGVALVGFVMDSASANRSAMMLEEDATLPPLINVACVSHTADEGFQQEHGLSGAAVYNGCEDIDCVQQQ
ncbi:MAG: hypothetical protein HC767_11855 [Akkermansiaceae bacterium]|nr:hypothetical protein [Akkermansiaceae bacterium]